MSFSEADSLGAEGTYPQVYFAFCAIKGPLSPQYTSRRKGQGGGGTPGPVLQHQLLWWGVRGSGVFFESVWRLEKSQRSRSTWAHNTVGTHRGGSWILNTPSTVCSRSCQASCCIKGSSSGVDWRWWSGCLGLSFYWISKSEILQWHTLQPKLMLFPHWTLTWRSCF